MTTKKLTPKQEMFVREYLVDLNATQAAIRAGYSEKSAYAIGEENLRKPEIATAVKKAMDERFEKTEIKAEWVLEKIKLAVERCEMEGDWHPYLKACELLGRYKKLFIDKIEIEDKTGLAERIAKARKKA